MKKMADRFFIAGCAAVVAAFGISVILREHKSFSEDENRVLSRFPKISAESILSGDFSYRLGKFYEDQFPLRRAFTSFKSLSERAMLRGENNGVIFGADGYLIKAHRYEDFALYIENLSAIDAFCKKYGAEGIETEVFFAPRGVDVLKDKLPKLYSNSEDRYLWDMASDKLPELLSANSEIETAAGGGEYVWYRNDHHWTPFGAYEGYKKIISRLGDEAKDISSFDYECISREFFGSVWSESGISGGVADELFVLRGEGEYSVINYDTGEIYDDFYFMEKASTKDKYAVFLGGNFGHIGIYREGARDTLVVIKDSFANCLVPFLSCHFNIEIYDLRYFEGRIGEEIEKEKADKILIIYGIDTVATDASLRLLGR